jgi:hypothetical protein
LPITRRLTSIATKEGLDSFLSTVYYSRMRFTLLLTPLLTTSPLPGHVISIYAGGMEDGTKPGESPIGLPPPEIYGVGSVRKYTCFMTTFFFEELAAKHAGKLSLSHIFPGLVDGPTFLSDDMPAWFRLIWRAVKPLAWFFMTPPDVCGQVMLYLGTSHFPASGAETTAGTVLPLSTKGEAGGGCYALGQRADVANQQASYAKVRTDKTSQKVWDHTMETFERIEKENTSPSVAS